MKNRQLILKVEKHFKNDTPFSILSFAYKLPITAKDFFFKLMQKEYKDETQRNAKLRTQTFSDASIVFCSFLEENLFLS